MISGVSCSGSTVMNTGTTVSAAGPAMSKASVIFFRVRGQTSGHWVNPKYKRL